LTGSLTGCTAGKPSVELSQAAPQGAGGTATVSVTVTQTQAVTRTTTVPVTSTVTVRATPTVTVTMLPRPALTRTTVFNRATALAGYSALLGDIRLLDRMPLAGSEAAVRLDALTHHFAVLAAGAPPPGLDAPTYYARLSSLRLFADAATREAEAGSPQAAARYTVIRQETGTFLALVNGALSTTYVLPPPPPPTPTPTTP
jgi:predicted secreted protein